MFRLIVPEIWLGGTMILWLAWTMVRQKGWCSMVWCPPAWPCNGIDLQHYCEGSVLFSRPASSCTLVDRQNPLPTWILFSHMLSIIGCRNPRWQSGSSCISWSSRHTPRQIIHIQYHHRHIFDGCNWFQCCHLLRQLKLCSRRCRACPISSNNIMHK